MGNKIKFYLESSDKGASFFALYAGLRMYKEQKQKTVPEGMVSIAGAEAFYMLEQLKENHPKEYKESEEEFNRVYVQKLDNGYTASEIEQCEVYLKKTTNCNIVRAFDQYIILAHDEADFRSKALKINHGQTLGFYSIKQVLRTINY